VEGVVRLDNRLYEFRKDKNHGREGRSYHKGKKQRYNKSPTRQLNATDRRPKLSDSERTRRREKGLCYECGQSGHLASFHHQKNNKGPRKQLNATHQIAMMQRVVRTTPKSAYSSTDTLPPYTETPTEETTSPTVRREHHLGEVYRTTDSESSDSSCSENGEVRPEEGEY
jgi:hypothetical protein